MAFILKYPWGNGEEVKKEKKQEVTVPISETSWGERSYKHLAICCNTDSAVGAALKCQMPGVYLAFNPVNPEQQHWR